MRKKNNNNLNEHDVLSIFSATVMSPHSLCVDTLSSWERRLLLPFLASFCKNKNLLQIVFTQQYTALYYTNIWCHSPLIKCFNMKSYQVGTQSGACGEELGPQNNPDWAFLNRKKTRMELLHLCCSESRVKCTYLLIKSVQWSTPWGSLGLILLKEPDCVNMSTSLLKKPQKTNTSLIFSFIPIYSSILQAYYEILNHFLYSVDCTSFCIFLNFSHITSCTLIYSLCMFFSQLTRYDKCIDLGPVILTVQILPTVLGQTGRYLGCPLEAASSQSCTRNNLEVSSLLWFVLRGLCPSCRLHIRTDRYQEISDYTHFKNTTVFVTLDHMTKLFVTEHYHLSCKTNLCLVFWFKKVLFKSLQHLI